MVETHRELIDRINKLMEDGRERVDAAMSSAEGGLKLPEFPNIFAGLEMFSKNVMTLGYIAVAIVGGIVIIKVADVVKD